MVFQRAGRAQEQPESAAGPSKAPIGHLGGSDGQRHLAAACEVRQQAFNCDCTCIYGVTTTVGLTIECRMANQPACAKLATKVLRGQAIPALQIRPMMSLAAFILLAWLAAGKSPAPKRRPGHARCLPFSPSRRLHYAAMHVP